VASGATPVGFFAQCYCFSEEGISVGWTHIFASSLVMELTTGVRRNHESWRPYNDTLTPVQLVPIAGSPISTVLRSAVGFNAGQWYPQANPDGIIPRVTFNVADSPNVGFDDRFLKNVTDFVFTFNDNVTYTHGTHTVKLGVAAPLDTNYSFAKRCALPRIPSCGRVVGVLREIESPADPRRLVSLTATRNPTPAGVPTSVKA
jgi:hypothetical protein